MGRKLLSYDEEIDKYLSQVRSAIMSTGVKHVSKTDALRFIIQQNMEVNLNFKRKAKSKKEYVFF